MAAKASLQAARAQVETSKAQIIAATAAVQSARAAVETARQIEEHAGLGEILVSGTVRDLVAGSGIRFQPKGFLAADGFELELLRLVEREVAARAAAV